MGILTYTKNLHLTTNKDELTLVVRKNLFKRCINNLISNGLTYGKNVYINLKSSSNLLTINIEDDGPGIDEEQYKNVFKPFFRLDRSRSLNKSGVGLGLSIAEDVINSHGGNIKLSRSKYNGLLVRVTLPF